MSTDAQDLLSSFDALPAEEQRVVAAAIVHRTSRPENSSEGIGESSEPHAREGTHDEDDVELLPPDEWVKRFRAWAHSHPSIRNPNLDDSREAMYEGCGE